MSAIFSTGQVHPRRSEVQGRFSYPRPCHEKKKNKNSQLDVCLEKLGVKMIKIHCMKFSKNSFKYYKSINSLHINAHARV